MSTVDTHASGHAQVFYLLDRPVHRGDACAGSATPIPGTRGRVLPGHARRGCWLYGRPEFQPDGTTRQPIHGILSLTRSQTWRQGSRRAGTCRVRPTTGEGRNTELFAALCKLGLGCSDDGLLTWARKLNSEFDPHAAGCRGSGRLAVCVPLPGTPGANRAINKAGSGDRRHGASGGGSLRCGTRGQARKPQFAVGRHAPQRLLVPRHRKGRGREPGDRLSCRCAKPIQLVPLRGQFVVLFCQCSYGLYTHTGVRASGPNLAEE